MNKDIEMKPDYEKLSIVDDLANKISKLDRSYNIEIRMELVHYSSLSSDYTFSFQLSAEDGLTERSFSSIDDLIKALEKELTPKDKFTIGQKVWVIDVNHVVSEAEITCRVGDDSFQVLYETGHRSVFDNERIYESELDLLRENFFRVIKENEALIKNIKNETAREGDMREMDQDKARKHYLTALENAKDSLRDVFNHKNETVRVPFDGQIRGLNVESRKPFNFQIDQYFPILPMHEKCIHSWVQGAFLGKHCEKCRLPYHEQ